MVSRSLVPGEAPVLRTQINDAVIPAQAGIQLHGFLDPRLRGYDENTNVASLLPPGEGQEEGIESMAVA